MQEFTRNSIIIAPREGGILELFSAEGELLAHFPLAPGRSKATRWLDLCGPDQILRTGEGVMVLEPAHRLHVQTFGEEAFASAANPDFQVSPADRMSRMLDQRLRKLEVTQATLRAKEAALVRAEASVTAKAKQDAPDPVVEVNASVQDTEGAAATE